MKECAKAVHELLITVRQWSGVLQPQSCWWCGGETEWPVM